MNYNITSIIKSLMAAAAVAIMASSAYPSTLRNPGVAERYGWSEGDSVIVIPASVRQIPQYAFAGMEGLKRVEFAPSSQCRKIGEYAFAECINLDSVSLPDGIGVIGEGAFRECLSLRSLIVPPQVWFIPKEMMHRCVALKRVVLPAGLQEIHAFAFAGCEGLEEIEIPAPVRKVGNNAFSRCVSLRELELPAGVKELESYAFSDCLSMRRLRLSGSYNMIGELIISGCSSLELLEVPALKPPFIECESYLFDPDDTAAYERCTLQVPAGSIQYYSRYHGWRLFRHIVPLTK